MPTHWHSQTKFWLGLLMATLLIFGGCAYRQETGVTTRVKQWGVFEKAIVSSNRYSPTQKYKDVVVNATFNGPSGVRYTVPGFWDGDNIWRIRFSPPAPGDWTYTIESTDDQLNAPQNDGGFTALAPTPEDINTNPNYRGFLKVSTDRRHLTYGDGTPFFWLGDTAWDANSKNMPYNTDFKAYVDNRTQKKFSVIQILVAEPRRRDVQLSNRGCHPPRYTGCNEAGYVFKLPSSSARILNRVYRVAGVSANEHADEINPRSFQNLDLRLKYIVDKGMVPYVVFAWATDFGRLSTDSLKSYVRYIVARYQAYNVIWCVAGEHYFVPDKTKFKAIGDYIREINAPNHLTTIHGWTGDFVGEPWLDFVSATAWGLPEKMYDILFDTLYRRGLPFVMTESRYDGNEPSEAYRPRKYAWEALAAGAMGYTYGADGIWDWGTDNRYVDARSRLNIPSSFQMKLMGDFLRRIEWWKLSPHDCSASGGRCLAETDKQYWVWLNGGGSVTLDLPKRSAKFSAAWLNPVTGATNTSNGVTIGGKQTFKPSFDGDAVFYIRLASS